MRNSQFATLTALTTAGSESTLAESERGGQLQFESRPSLVSRIKCNTWGVNGHFLGQRFLGRMPSEGFARPAVEQPGKAVLTACWQRPDREPLVLHSDRGTQFTSGDYQRFLADHHILSSMSAVGHCADNAAAEGFFGMIKRERVHRPRYLTLADARSDMFDYIERFHNPRMQRRIDARDQAFTALT